MKSPIRLADRSDNPRHRRALDALYEAVAHAQNHPEFNAAFVVVAKTREVPGQYDELEFRIFSADLNDLEAAGLMATLAGMPRTDEFSG